MAENLPNVGKESDSQIQEAQKVPNKDLKEILGAAAAALKKSLLRHIIIKMSKVKDNGENIKNSKRKTTCYIQGNPLKAISRLFSTQIASQKGLAQYIQNDKRKKTSNQ